MFDLEKREKIIILCLSISLLAGISVKHFFSSRPAIEPGIRAFQYKGPAFEPKKIDINKAGIDELDLLDGIGPSLAGRIIEYRQKYGPFTRVEDLKNVKGIGDKLFDRIKNEVSAE